MTNSQTFDYEKTLKVLEEIKECLQYPKFEKTFGSQSQVIQQIVYQTIDAVEKKEEPKLIMKSLKELKDLAIGISGSLIATGIVESLNAIM